MYFCYMLFNKYSNTQKIQRIARVRRRQLVVVVTGITSTYPPTSPSTTTPATTTTPRATTTTTATTRGPTTTAATTTTTTTAQTTTTTTARRTLAPVTGTSVKRVRYWSVELRFRPADWDTQQVSAVVSAVGWASAPVIITEWWDINWLPVIFCSSSCNGHWPSVLWLCWQGVRKSIRSVKIEWWGVGVVVCLERGADCLHMVQLMPLPSPNPIISWLI